MKTRLVVKAVVFNQHNEFRWVPLGQAIELIIYEPQKNALQYIKEHNIEI